MSRFMEFNYAECTANCIRLVQRSCEILKLRMFRMPQAKMASSQKSKLLQQRSLRRRKCLVKVKPRLPPTTSLLASARPRRTKRVMPSRRARTTRLVISFVSRALKFQSGPKLWKEHEINVKRMRNKYERMDHEVSVIPRILKRFEICFHFYKKTCTGKWRGIVRCLHRDLSHETDSGQRTKTVERADWWSGFIVFLY